MNDERTEQLLRQAPAPTPPPDLKQRLLADIALPARPTRAGPEPGSFRRRWLPALSFGVLLFGCLIGLAIQTIQLIGLRQENATLRAATANLEQFREENAERQALLAADRRAAQRQGRVNDELDKLRAEAQAVRLTAGELQTVRAENERLQQRRREALAAANADVEDDPLARAREKAERIACINNIKQICLAALMWANDHGDVLPERFTQLTKELRTPKVLICPSDKGKPRPATWAEADESSFSYELLSPGLTRTTDPSIVLSRCRIHHNCGLIDGSAQQLDPKTLRIEKVDGHYRITRVPAVDAQPEP